MASVTLDTAWVTRSRAVRAGETKAPAGHVCSKGCFNVTALLATESTSAASVFRLSLPITSRPSASYSRFVVVIGITVLPAVIAAERNALSGQMGKA